MNANPKRVYSHLPVGYRLRRSPNGAAYRIKVRRWASVGLSLLRLPAYLALASFNRVPGLQCHWAIAKLGMRLLLRRRLTPYHYIIRWMLVAPLDSVRHFEFDFMWRALQRNPPHGRYLDVSSPRSLPLLVLTRYRLLAADVLNPDASDLAITSQLLSDLGIGECCALHQHTVEAGRLTPRSYDLITCMSVLEHIPDDRRAIETIWRLLNPGGRLLLSVMCAAEAFDEFVDHNEYGLLESDADGFVFFQRFYDERLLAERLFSVTGEPVGYEIVGEKRRGALVEHRNRQLGAAYHDVSREAYQYGQMCAQYDAISGLPGWGVIGMEFVKP